MKQRDIEKAEDRARTKLLEFLQGHSLEFALELIKWLHKNGYEIRKIEE